MGWSSGTYVAAPIIDKIEALVEDRNLRVDIFKALIDAFEDADCDTLSELCWDDEAGAFAEAYYTLHPEHRDED